MGRASPAIVGFDGGEFSPQMEGRVDVDKYAIASHIQQNFIPLKQGPATKRSGSVYVSQTKNNGDRVWLVHFQFSQTQAFILEFGNLYVRFYVNHGPLLSTGNAAYSNSTAYVLGNQVVQSGVTYYCTAPTTGNAPPNASYWYALPQYNGSTTQAIYEIPSPYAVADLTSALGEFALQIQQSGDVLYIAGGYAGVGPAGVGYPPYTLTRFSNAPPNWQFAPYTPTDGPYADPVPLVPGQEIAISASGVQGNITVTAWGGNLFAPTDVGRLIRIQSQVYNVLPWATSTGWTAGQSCVNNGNNYLALTTATSQGSPPVHTAGSVLDGPTGVRWLYTDSGYGVCRITGYTDAQHVSCTVLLRLPANVVGASYSITGITNASPAVISATNSITVGQPIFIVGVAGMTQVNQTPYTNQTTSTSTVTLAGIDSTGFGTYTSGGTVIANATVEWQLGAWSNTTEWPRAAGFFKDRLFWATKIQIFGSVPGLYTSHAPDFFNQQTTDSAINVRVTGSDTSSICWLNGANVLVIGTEGGEYGLDAANYSTSPLGPSNVEILRQSNWRCRHIPAVLVGVSLLYVQRAGRKVFAADYNFYLNRYDSTDQSKFGYHITIGGMCAVAYQQEPWSLLWCVRNDGTLLSYTFNREDNVTAWSRHNLGGGGIVESIQTIPSPDGLRDELWMVVNRTVNGASIRTVEYLAKPFEGAQAGQAGDAQSSAWYVDCGVQFKATAVPATISAARVTVAGDVIHGFNTTCTVTVNNTAQVGQTIQISGVIYTGTFPINGMFQIVACSSSTVTFTLPGSFTFAYVSGGITNLSAPSTGITSISGLPAVMWNQTVSILADGGVQAPMVVSSTGTVSLPGTFTLVNIGFSYQANIVPMRTEGGADTGTAQGKKKQGANLVIRLVDSVGGAVGQLSNQMNGLYLDPLSQTTLAPQLMEAITYNYTTTALDSPPPIQSGDFPVSFPANPSSDQDASDFYILVQHSDPTPFTVVGLFPDYKVEEWQ